MNLRYEEKPGLTPEQVAALRESVGWDGISELYEKILGTTYFCVGCFDGDTLVGYVDVVSDGVCDAYIRDLVVHPDYQWKGIGSKLLSIAIEKVKEDGIYATNTLFEPALTDFYKKAGFHIMSGGIIINKKQ